MPDRHWTHKLDSFLVLLFILALTTVVFVAWRLASLSDGDRVKVEAAQAADLKLGERDAWAIRSDERIDAVRDRCLALEKRVEKLEDDQRGTK